MPLLVFPVFPEPLQVIVGGAPLSQITADIIADSAFTDISIVYYPSRPKLQATNDFELAVEDRVENDVDPVHQGSFTYP